MADILILSSDFPPARGGIATDSFNLYTLLGKRHNVHAHIFGIQGENTDSVIYHNIPKILYMRELKSLFRQDFDMIILRTMFPLAWMTGLIRPDAKTVLFVYGQEIIARNYLKLRPSVKWTLEHMDQIISISRFTDSLINRESSIFYPLIDSTQYEAMDKKMDSSIFTIGTMGRIENHKNHMALLRNIRSINEALRGSCKAVKYIIAGQGASEYALQDYVMRNGLEQIVVFMHCPDNKSRNAFYNSIDMLVMPSVRNRNHVEGFGIVVQEAGLYGKPSVGYASGGMGESLEFEDVQCPEGDEECLCSKITEMALDEDRYARAADAAFKRAQQYVISEKRLNEIDDLLGIGSGGRI